MLLNPSEISRRNLSGPCNTLSNQCVCTVQCTVYTYSSVLCTNLPQILRLLICLLIYIHLHNLCIHLYSVSKTDSPLRGRIQGEVMIVMKWSESHNPEFLAGYFGYLNFVILLWRLSMKTTCRLFSFQYFLNSLH